MSNQPSEKVVTIFRSRLVESQRDAYAAIAPEIYQLATSMPGFVSAKTFSAPDGERVTLVEFDSMENHRAWSDHPRHVEAKKRGIAEFYAEYHILRFAGRCTNATLSVRPRTDSVFPS